MQPKLGWRLFALTALTVHASLTTIADSSTACVTKVAEVNTDMPSSRNRWLTLATLKRLKAHRSILKPLPLPDSLKRRLDETAQLARVQPFRRHLP